ncbi:hypothetical protein E4U10_008022 [Claviceps purpurea]|nr:hypothetical protein E4U10_008022 [Claviceps purpurea]
MHTDWLQPESLEEVEGFQLQPASQSMAQPAPLSTKSNTSAESARTAIREMGLVPDPVDDEPKTLGPRQLEASPTLRPGPSSS